MASCEQCLGKARLAENANAWLRGSPGLNAKWRSHHAVGLSTDTELRGREYAERVMEWEGLVRHTSGSIYTFVRKYEYESTKVRKYLRVLKYCILYLDSTLTNERCEDRALALQKYGGLPEVHDHTYFRTTLTLYVHNVRVHVQLYTISFIYCTRTRTCHVRVQYEAMNQLWFRHHFNQS